MYWTLELASKLEDAPWPATKDELIDFAIRSGAPMEVIENLQEIEDEGDIYESIEDIWPDYPSKDDFFFNEEEIVVYTKIADLQLVKENLEKANFEIASAGLEYVPKEKINLSEEDEEKLQKLLDALEEQNEVSEYYTNGENF